MRHVRFLAGMAALATTGPALADDAYLRLRCDGEAAGAEVRINNVKKGECPLDLVVPEGKVKLSVRKTVDEYRFKTFEKELFLSAGAMKRETVVLGPLQFTAEGQRLEDERVAREKAAAEAQAAALAEKKRREEEARKKIGMTQVLTATIKTGRDPRDPDQPPIGPSLWSMVLTFAPVYYPLSTMSDLSSGKDLVAKAADPVVFANPDAMVSRVARAVPSQQPVADSVAPAR